MGKSTAGQRRSADWTMLSRALFSSPQRPGARLVTCVRQASTEGAKKTLSQLAAQGGIRAGQTVLVRVDLNVPFSKTEPGVITDDTRLRGAVPTIQFLREQGAKVVLATHCGRPKGTHNPEFSIAPIAEALSTLLDTAVGTTADCIGPDVQSEVSALQPGDVMMLENVRFHSGETENDPEFARALAEASCADVFVNDAFGTAHRAHASTAGVAAHMKHSVAGFLVAKELEFLEKAVLKAPQRPLVAIIGGAKVSTKIPVIKSLMKACDTVIVVGGMTGTFFKAKGYNTANSFMEQDLVPLASEFMDFAESNPVNLYVPRDVVIGRCDGFDSITNDIDHKAVAADSVPDGWMKLDIGPESLEEVKQILNDAETVLWNGPPGVFEFEPFAVGTNAIAQAMADITSRGATTVIGGGDSVYAVTKLGLQEQVSHVSTGGGAALELLEGLTLPGIAALDNA